MTNKELIILLEEYPGNYEVIFESHVWISTNPIVSYKDKFILFKIMKEINDTKEM